MSLSPIRDSVEYLKFSMADSGGANITGDVVAVAVAARGTAVGSFTWLPCTYLSGTTWRTTTAVTWSAANYPGLNYHVWAKVTDSPETPWCDLGHLTITEH